MNLIKTYSLSDNNKLFYSKPKVNLESDSLEIPTDQHCGYYYEQRALTKLTISIDGEVGDAAYYRHAVNKISELGEGDVVVFKINTPGGDLSGLVELLHAINNTEAETIAEVVGDAYSAGSLLALACDSITIGKYANFLCHSCSFGSRGKSTDVQRHVNHLSKYAEDIFRECYAYFLSDEEIEDVLEGKELYLNYDEINERLEHKYKILQEMNDKQEEDM